MNNYAERMSIKSIDVFIFFSNDFGVYSWILLLPQWLLVHSNDSLLFFLGVEELEDDYAKLEKELEKANKAISKSKSKKETQALLNQLISFIE